MTVVHYKKASPYDQTTGEKPLFFICILFRYIT